MDFWTKAFLYLGSAIAAMMLLVALIVLSNAENGQLTVEGVQHLSEPMESFYGIMKILVYIWLIPAAVMLFRFIRSFFSR